MPVVRNTGGLADTVENYDEETGGGTGFVLDDLTPQSVYNTIDWAVRTWVNRPEHIKAMQKRAMKKDFTWTSSAKQYLKVYQEALKK